MIPKGECGTARGTEEILQKQPWEVPRGAAGCEGSGRNPQGAGREESLPGAWPAGCNRIPVLASHIWPGTPSQGGPEPGPLPLEGWALGRGGGGGGALRGQEGRGGPSVLRRQGPGTPAPAQLLPSVSLPAGRSRGPAGLYIFLTGPSSEARKEQQWSSPHGDPFVR